MDYTKRNVEQVRHLIEQKNGSQPFSATAGSIAPIINDMDHHPYTRFYRGVEYFPEPIIFEREAGWRPIENQCYQVNIPPQKVEHPHSCYQNACSTVLPCYPQYLTKDSDKELLDTLLNHTCIVQYR